MMSRIVFRKGLLVTALALGMLLGLSAHAMAATITVDTTADQYNTDPSHCSLREAIKSVDGASGGDPTGANFGGCVASGSYATSVDPPDTIMVPGGNFQLTLSGSAEDNDVSGDLDVFRSMNIAGTGNPTIQQTIAGNRVLDVSATGKDLSLSGLTITGGDQTSSDGGGIHFRGGSGAASLTLNGVTVTGNDINTTGNGGGIYTDSPTTIANSTITDNHTNLVTAGLTGNGGGIYSDGFTDSFTGVTLSIDHSSITGNSAGDAVNFGSGGGIFRATKATDGTSNAVIQGTDISGNNAHFFGGGIDTHSDATLDVKGSLISGNRAFVLRGGGMEADASTASQGGTLNLVNTTVTGNQANADGGGVHAGNDGKVNVNLLFSTLAQNTGNPGSELAMDGVLSPKPSYTVEGTVFVATDPSQMNACNITGSNFINRTDNGYNVSTDPTDATLPAAAGPGCGIFSVAPGDRTGVSGTLVNGLADNGGPTKTMQPTSASFALDNMPNSVCTAITPAVTADQRGYPRPDSSGGNCDSGAYEAFTCSGTVLNTPGPFAGCPVTPPPGGGGGGGGGGASPTSPATPKKKCKKKKHRAAAAKKCKKKKK
jgi:CSLREA domain-containing protein